MGSAHRTLGAVAILCLAATVLPAAEVPLGHPDFYPTPERPVGWRGDGNGAFPGATLSVTKFGDGPLEKKSREYIDRGKKKTQWWHVLKDEKPFGIVWRFELPGFTHSQPIIVAHRVIITCEPHTVLCVDINEGRELWRRDLDPFTLIGLPPRKAEQLRRVADLNWVQLAITNTLVGNYGRLPKMTPELRKRWHAMAARQVGLAGELEKVQAGLQGGIVSAIAKSKAAATKLEGWLREGVTLPKPRDAKKGIEKDIVDAFRAVWKPVKAAVYAAHNVNTTSHWYTYVGNAWPTPTSDGEAVFVAMGQGQIARLDLEGNVVWAVKSPLPKKAQNMPVPRSPVLIGDVVIVTGSGNTRGFDKETGETLWTAKGSNANGNTGFTPKHMRIDGERDVLVHFGGGRDSMWALDPTTGELLAEAKLTSKGAHDPGPSNMGEGNLVHHPYGGLTLKLGLGEGGSVTMEEVWQKYTYGGNALILHDGKVFTSGKTYDLRSGDLVKGMGIGGFGRTEWQPGILVGAHAVTPSSKRLNLGKHGPRLPYAMCGYNITEWSTGKGVSGMNVLGHRLPKVPWLEEIAPDLYREGKLYNECGGAPPKFGYGGLFAQGNRLLIPSTARLYCIGDPGTPYNGTRGPRQ